MPNIGFIGEKTTTAEGISKKSYSGLVADYDSGNRATYKLFDDLYFSGGIVPNPIGSIPTNAAHFSYSTLMAKNFVLKSFKQPTDITGAESTDISGAIVHAKEAQLLYNRENQNNETFEIIMGSSLVYNTLITQGYRKSQFLLSGTPISLDIPDETIPYDAQFKGVKFGIYPNDDHEALFIGKKGITILGANNDDGIMLSFKSMIGANDGINETCKLVAHRHNTNVSGNSLKIKINSTNTKDLSMKDVMEFKSSDSTINSNLIISGNNQLKFTKVSVNEENSTLTISNNNSTETNILTHFKNIGYKRETLLRLTKYDSTNISSDIVFGSTITGFTIGTYNNTNSTITGCFDIGNLDTEPIINPNKRTRAHQFYCSNDTSISGVRTESQILNNGVVHASKGFPVTQPNDFVDDMIMPTGQNIYETDNRGGPWYGLGYDNIIRTMPRDIPLMYYAGKYMVPITQLSGFYGVALRSHQGSLILSEGGVVCINYNNEIEDLEPSYNGWLNPRTGVNYAGDPWIKLSVRGNYFSQFGSIYLQGDPLPGSPGVQTGQITCSVIKLRGTTGHDNIILNGVTGKIQTGSFYAHDIQTGQITCSVIKLRGDTGHDNIILNGATGNINAGSFYAHEVYSGTIVNNYNITCHSNMYVNLNLHVKDDAHIGRIWYMWLMCEDKAANWDKKEIAIGFNSTNNKLMFKKNTDLWNAYYYTNGENTFTGSHQSFVDTSVETRNLFDEEHIGKIVSSTGKHEKLTISDSWPYIKLSNQINDPSVYGVISGKEVDINDNTNRVKVNSLGEGAIWVCDAHGNLKNGDYITSCLIPGIGIKQLDDVLHNYTVAKITMNCDFNPQNVPKKKVRVIESIESEEVVKYEEVEKFEEKVIFDEVLKRYVRKKERSVEKRALTQQYPVYDESGNILKDRSGVEMKHTIELKEKKDKIVKRNAEDDRGNTIYEDEVDDQGNIVYIPQYEIKYVDLTGNYLTKESYEERKQKNDLVYIIAFVGCTYHCG